MPIEQRNPYLPWQFCTSDFRFLRVKAKSKQPEGKWTEIINHVRYDDPSLIEWLRDGNNVGMLGGYGGLCIVDCDRRELEEALRRNLPATMTEKSAKGTHFFFLLQEGEFFLQLDLTENHFGEIRADRGHQTVVSPSIHESGMQYTVQDNLPIAFVTKEKLMEAIMPFTEKREIPWATIQQEQQKGKKFPLEVIIGPHMASMKRLPNGEFQGSHPFHDSTTGQNFCANPAKDLWYCFRHGRGGNALHLIAQKEGLVACGQPLIGHAFMQALTVAKEKYGMNISDFFGEDVQPTPSQELYFQPFEKYGIPDPIKWLMHNYIPNKGVTIIGGAPGCGKSLITDEIMCAILNRRKVFGEFEILDDTAGKPIILLDLENDHATLYKRIKALGGVPENMLWVYNLEAQFTILNVDQQKALKDLIDKVNPCLIVFDTFRRLYTGDENDSKEVSRIYTEILGPLSKRIPCILIAHARKPDKKRGTNADKLAEIRGTGDIAGIASSVLFVEQNQGTKSFYITCEKLRSEERPGSLTVALKKEFPDTPEEKWTMKLLEQNKIIITEDEKAANETIAWLTQNYATNESVPWGEIKENMVSKGFSESAVYRALSILQEQKILEKPRRGIYVVKIETSMRPTVAPVEQQMAEEEEPVAEKTLNLIKKWLKDNKHINDIIPAAEFQTAGIAVGISRSHMFRVINELEISNIIMREQRGYYKFIGVE